MGLALDTLRAADLLFVEPDNPSISVLPFRTELNILLILLPSFRLLLLNQVKRGTLRGHQRYIAVWIEDSYRGKGRYRPSFCEL